jgi:hypothetical protein
MQTETVSIKQARFEVADVLRKLDKKVERIGLNPWQLRTLRHIKHCRTAALGGHIDACDDCGNISISYNSCRNRHCPKCQGKNREQWIQAREQELLPVPYFHVVFTLPDSINTLSMHQPKLVYDLLFESAWETLRTFGKNKGVLMGAIGVLHTWGQNLSLHPHLHCIVPGGGINENGHWQNIRADGKFLFPVKALSQVFRAKFCDKLLKLAPEHYQPIRQKLWSKKWVVYAKRPFGSSKSVIEYLGRYTHKIAISNHRIKSIDDKTVTFAFKDYKSGGTKKQMTLSHEEFIRRFALHILPKRFVKIRHYGFLSSNWKRQKLLVLQEKMQVRLPEPKAIEQPERICPCCKVGKLITIQYFDGRGPPQREIGAGQKSLKMSDNLQKS